MLDDLDEILDRDDLEQGGEFPSTTDERLVQTTVDEKAPVNRWVLHQLGIG